MSGKSWLPFGTGFLLLSLAVFVWSKASPADSPASPNDTAGKTKSTRALAERSTISETCSRHSRQRTADTWRKEDLPSAVDTMFADGGGEPVAEALRIELLNRWVACSPADAAAWAQSMPPGAVRDSAINQTALTWGATDSHAAWDWVSSLETGSARDTALLAIAYESSRDDPALAFERSEALPQGLVRTQLTEHAVANWAALDPQAALAQVGGIGDPSLRNAALGSLATAWAESDPLAAAALVASAMEPGSHQDRAVASVVQRWARLDPEAAGSWVATFPDSPIKDNALEHIANIAK